MRTKLLPTAAPKPVPPEFLEKFVKHGWRRVEHIWGKSTVLAWSKTIGVKRMAEARRKYLRECAQEGAGARKAAVRYSEAKKPSSRSSGPRMENLA